MHTQATESVIRLQVTVTPGRLMRNVVVPALLDDRACRNSLCERHHGLG